MSITDSPTWARLEKNWDKGFVALSQEEQETIALWWLEAETMNGTEEAAEHGDLPDDFVNRRLRFQGFNQTTHHVSCSDEWPATKRDMITRDATPTLSRPVG